VDCPEPAVRERQVVADQRPRRSALRRGPRRLPGAASRVAEILSL